MIVPFNHPHVTGKELQYIEEALHSKHLSGDGPFTRKCQTWMEENLNCKKVLLTPSCTAAMEMAALMLEISPGDEVIMPSYTFVSTANAFVLRGAIPVFVDIRSDTLNIDENQIEAAITEKTKAIIIVHYAGVACNMDKIMDLAAHYGLYVLEDAAQALMSKYKNKHLGTLGHLGAFSFHATKNIISGEGGALCINDDNLLDRAEIIWEKGTNRKQFFRGKVDKYSWVDIGSSYLPSEITAAFLYAQLEEAHNITCQRLALWNIYQAGFKALEDQKILFLPTIPEACEHNAHIFYLRLPDQEFLMNIMGHCKKLGIETVTHFVPLHDSLAGKKYGRHQGALQNTSNLSVRILRIPLWIGIDKHQHYIIENLSKQISYEYKNAIERMEL